MEQTVMTVVQRLEVGLWRECWREKERKLIENGKKGRFVSPNLPLPKLRVEVSFLPSLLHPEQYPTPILLNSGGRPSRL